MAKVTLTITDTGSNAIEAVIEADPDIPLKGEGPDVDSPEFTNAMAAGWEALAHIQDLARESEQRTERR